MCKKKKNTIQFTNGMVVPNVLLPEFNINLWNIDAYNYIQWNVYNRILITLIEH